MSKSQRRFSVFRCTNFPSCSVKRGGGKHRVIWEPNNWVSQITGISGCQLTGSFPGGSDIYAFDRKGTFLKAPFLSFLYVVAFSPFAPTAALGKVMHLGRVYEPSRACPDAAGASTEHMWVFSFFKQPFFRSWAARGIKFWVKHHVLIPGHTKSKLKQGTEAQAHPASSAYSETLWMRNLPRWWALVVVGRSSATQSQGDREKTPGRPQMRAGLQTMMMQNGKQQENMETDMRRDMPKIEEWNCYVATHTNSSTLKV